MALCTLQFADGIASAISIRQSETYGGLLEGSPSKRLDKKMIANAVGKAELLWAGIPVVVMLPGQSPDDRLPPILCMTLIEREDSTATDIEEKARIVLVHFENSFIPQFSASTLNRFSKTPWTAFLADNLTTP